MPPKTHEEPLHLTEDMDTGDRFLVYSGKDGVQIDLLVFGNTFCATQAQMAQMFGVKIPAISKHLSRIFAEGELCEESVVSIKEITAADGKTYSTKLYGLDALIAVGYRIEGRLGTMFRIWATDKLFQYLTKGFVIDVRRLEAPAGRPDYFGELLEKIRHIRASEKRMWTRVLELASFCSDYGLMTEQDKHDFFAAIQNAMHWATTQKTAAEVICERVNRDAPDAGLTHIAGEYPTVAEACIAKNYYGETEIATLNLVTSMTLEFFESQAEQRRPTTIAQFLAKMRELLKLDGRPLIGENERGAVSMAEARKKAAAEVAAYKERIRVEREKAGELRLKELSEAVKSRRK